MMQLVGRFVLGCILAVHVLADIATEQPLTSSPELLAVTTPKALGIDVVTENLKKSSPSTPSPPPEITKRITLPETSSTPDKNTKIFGVPIKEKEKVEREIVVIHNQSPSESHHSDHGYHDHHGHHDHHYDQDYHRHPPPNRPPPHHHDHDYHHHPPPTRLPPPHHYDHHHHPSPPHHQHYPQQPYPSYYPPHHYPPPMPYSHGMPQPYAAAGAVPYPYYPPPMYYHQTGIRPASTVIQESTTTNSQSLSKPTDLLYQGTEYLWNLFGRLGAVTHDNHEVVVIHPKPVMPSPTVVAVQTLPTDFNPDKTKRVLTTDCNHKEQ